MRRYTDLASTIDILSRRRIVLLDPAKWDDQNDVYFINAYKETTGAKSVLALCMSSLGETYHHWRVLSGHSSGVCVEFFRKELVDHIESFSGVRSSRVKYMTLPEIENKQPSRASFPFIKRYAFRFEKEFRLIYESKDIEEQAHPIQIPLSLIHGIRLSPWLAASLAEVTRDLLKPIPGCDKLSITRSDLLNNERFQNAVTLVSGVRLGARKRRL